MNSQKIVNMSKKMGVDKNYIFIFVFLIGNFYELRISVKFKYSSLHKCEFALAANYLPV